MSKPKKELNTIEHSLCVAWTLNRVFESNKLNHHSFKPGGIVGEVHKNEAIINKRK